MIVHRPAWSAPISQNPAIKARTARVPFALVCSLSIVVAVHAESPQVTISGGGDLSAQNYEWTVRNAHGSPIVFVEFPHYRAGMFEVPEGWEMDCTFLVNVGVPDVPGICKASVSSATVGIAPGRSGEFRMRIGPRGAIRGNGDVLVRFADGVEHVVTGVELPRSESAGEKNLPLVGLTAMLLLAVIVHRIRARSKPRE